MIRFALGELRVTVLNGGSLWLDGGAMFGVVPKTLWQKEREPDASLGRRVSVTLLRRMVAEGRLGKKSGRGFYDWTKPA